MDYDYETTAPSALVTASNNALVLYDVTIVFLGISIILLNLLVVVSSGLLLEKREY